MNSCSFAAVEVQFNGIDGRVTRLYTLQAEVAAAGANGHGCPF